jgi:hypothetical protein
MNTAMVKSMERDDSSVSMQAFQRHHTLRASLAEVCLSNDPKHPQARGK